MHVPRCSRRPRRGVPQAARGDAFEQPSLRSPFATCKLCSRHAEEGGDVGRKQEARGWLRHGRPRASIRQKSPPLATCISSSCGHREGPLRGECCTRCALAVGLHRSRLHSPSDQRAFPQPPHAGLRPIVAAWVAWHCSGSGFHKSTRVERRSMFDGPTKRSDRREYLFGR